MQFFILWIMFISLLVTLAPFARPEGFKLVDEVKKAEVQAPEPAPAAVSGTDGSFIQQGISEMVQQAGIENPITIVKKTAEDAARSVGRSLGQYIQGQYQHKKNEDLLQRFDDALFQNFSGLQLNSEEKRLMVVRIEDAYIQDAESGKYELDQQNFRDLPKVIKKEYAEIELARTQNGNVPTYDYKGALKTLWGVKNGVLNGPAVTYYPSGEIKYIDLYENGRKVNRKKYDEEGKLTFEQNYDYQKTAPASVQPSGKESVSILAPEEKAPQTVIVKPPVQAGPASAESQSATTVPFKELQPAAPKPGNSENS